MAVTVMGYCSKNFCKGAVAVTVMGHCIWQCYGSTEAGTVMGKLWLSLVKGTVDSTRKRTLWLTMLWENMAIISMATLTSNYKSLSSRRISSHFFFSGKAGYQPLWGLKYH